MQLAMTAVTLVAFGLIAAYGVLVIRKSARGLERLRIDLGHGVEPEGKSAAAIATGTLIWGIAMIGFAVLGAPLFIVLIWA
ncbi:MAG: hypothetical protein AAGB29_02505 [Planctomycetota bacterium]